jgi:5-oxoprolinase (ATP-hydrolysing) subunit B
MTIEPEGPGLRLSRMGEAAFLLESGFSPDIGVQARICKLASIALQWQQVLEVVPGVNNLLVVFDPCALDADNLESALRRKWDQIGEADLSGREIEIPVEYGGTSGEDLADVAAFAGLPPEEYVRRHSECHYRVVALGAMPGLPYLSGLDPALSRPRRDVPRQQVRAGAIIVGGTQASILPITAPCGWHIVGRTNISLFDPSAAEPTLLAPGDYVRFRVERFES